ncbi:glycosyltransferase [Lichenicola sp.]|uniref:glycosyltransferase n=1 Tax=Lichenicola sp. TaxID=2804529 RepID=UPI003AFFAE41
MRILLTTDAIGGVWRYSLTLAHEWAALGVPVDLAVLGPPPDRAQRNEAEAIRGLSLHDTGLDLDWTAPDHAALQRSANGLAALAGGCGSSSVHLHAPALVGATVDWPAPVVAMLHSCLATWWQTLRHGPPPEDFRWRIDATGDGIRRAAHVVAPTHAFRDAVLAAYGDLAPIAVVHNGRHPHPAPADPPSARPRQVLAAGRFWDEGKDVVTLDAAARLIDAPVLAAGSFRDPAGRETSAPGLVRLGSLDEPALANAYAHARAFISTTRYEPFGLAVLEAAQAGLPLVLSDIPSFRELWDGAALFVTPGNAAGFAAAINRALDDDPDARGGAAHERARRYTATAMAEATLALHHPRHRPERIT